MNGKYDDKADEKSYRIAYLIAGFIKQTLTIDEHDELDDWVNASDENMIAFERLSDETNIGQLEKLISEHQQLRAKKITKKKLQFKKSSKQSQGSLIKMIAIAASLLLVLTVIFVLMNRNKSISLAEDAIVIQDIAPGTYTAMLQLSNGEQIKLNAEDKGRIAREGFVGINQSSDGLIYSDSGFETSAKINKLIVPIKAHYKLLLSDGTKVWLNAGSELSFPASFDKHERLVKLSGEGYFEVAKDHDRPFKVIASNSETVVLGTHFNISAYTDEETATVSLLEGAVMIHHNNASTKLSPNEEVVFGSNMFQKRDIKDSTGIIGWKNGFFEFHDASIKQIMSQLSKWYGVSINYQYESEHLFNASIQRTVPLSKILKYLQLTNKVHFRVENEVITVMK